MDPTTSLHYKDEPSNFKSTSTFKSFTITSIIALTHQNTVFPS
jgi:hypothetical protein